MNTHKKDRHTCAYICWGVLISYVCSLRVYLHMCVYSYIRDRFVYVHVRMKYINGIYIRTYISVSEFLCVSATIDVIYPPSVPVFIMP